MIVREFRIPMPLTLEEYQIAQLHTMVETAKLETGGGDGIEDIINEPFVDHDMGSSFGIRSGQYTVKKFHLDHKVPMFVRIFTPKDYLHLQEESWNAFPYCRTVMSNEYLGERLQITIDTIHLPDRGNTENALNLPPEKLEKREIVYIDIACDLGSEESCITEPPVKGATSRKTGRGPLQPNWVNTCQPMMTCYKLVTVEARIFGLGGRLETFVVTAQKRVLTAFHRRMFFHMDQWYGLTMEDIRALERATAVELEQQRKFGELRGTRAAKDD